ncbi:MAG: zinc-ribbon domain-containing protein [Candidatus Angelobacter sp.]
MALCTSCGNQVEESASFCTSCGKPMPAAAHPSAAVTVARPVCSSCGAHADPGSVFCTECGKRLDAQAGPVDRAAPAVAATMPPMAETAAPTASPNPFCISCGTKIEPGTAFCTHCGQPAADGSTKVPEPEKNVAPQTQAPEATQPVLATSVRAKQTKDPSKTEPVVAAPAPTRVESTPAAVAAMPLVEDRPVAAVPVQPTLVEPGAIEPTPVEPAPQIAVPLYATPSDHPPTQPRGSAFRIIVMILLLLIVVGGFGGWYFMGVETVIVCSPPDVTVFLDSKELQPTSYGRYVIPHLSRQPHLLRVQRAGFADTIERLDFPMSSLHEWVNIKLVPRRQTRPSSLR